MGFSERANTILNKTELFLSHVRGKTVLGNVKGGEVPWEVPYLKHVDMPCDTHTQIADDLSIAKFACRSNTSAPRSFHILVWSSQLTLPVLAIEGSNHARG